MTGKRHHGEGPRPVATGGFAFDEATMRVADQGVSADTAPDTSQSES